MTESDRPTTVSSYFEWIASERGEAPAMRTKRDGVWRETSWEAYRTETRRAARGFLALGLEPGDTVTILGFNRREWFVADIGAILAGGVPAGIYTTCSAEQCHYIADHAGARVAVVENQDQLAKFLEIRGRLPRLAAVIVMEGEGDGDFVLSWSELLNRGEGVSEAALDERIAAQQPNDLATLIYTSGTTGPPKAVMLSHSNILWTAAAVVEQLEVVPSDNFLSYLPMSHIAEQMVSLHGPMHVGACCWFAESIEKLGVNLPEVRPQVFLGVPRVWEKIQAAVAAAGAESTGLKKKIAAWARRKGLEGGYAQQQGRPLPAFYSLADRLVFSKVRRKLGLDRARVCATSAAPITLDTLEFFLSLGIPILEIYGMSEVTGPGTISRPDRYRTGKAGFPLPGTEIRIAGDGEVLMRGPHVFLGYLKNPEATAETLTADGWVRSGDIGHFDDDGFLKITDRKKELIITSGGKNISPAELEAKLKGIPIVAAAAVIGDGRNYLTALVTLDPERLAADAEQAGSPARTPEEAAGCERFAAWLEDQVAVVNRSLAKVETIKKVKILPGQFTIEGGELTPTMKLKRRVVFAKFEPEIEALYS